MTSSRSYFPSGKTDRDRQSMTLNAERALAHDWRQWIVANQAAGTPAESLVEVLISRGVPEAVARKEVKQPDPELLLDLARQQLAVIHNHERQLENYQALFALGQDDDNVPRRELPSRAEFLSEFYSANRAVVLTGVMDGSPVLGWTPASLRDRFGEEPIEVQTNRRSEPIWDVFLKGKTEVMLLREYVDLVERSGATNEFYMTGNDGFLSRAGARKLTGEVTFGAEYLDVASTARNVHLWFGPEGAVSPLHRDRVNVLKAQVYGRKRILLVHSNQMHRVYNERSFYSELDAESPDLGRFPRFKGVRVHVVTLHPGECLFIPVGWWHHVRSLDVSMSLTFTNFAFPNKFA
jgi:Cupin-like domain